MPVLLQAGCVLIKLSFGLCFNTVCGNRNSTTLLFRPYSIVCVCVRKDSTRVLPLLSLGKYCRGDPARPLARKAVAPKK